jgi:hypothetical protein
MSRGFPRNFQELQRALQNAQRQTGGGGGAGGPGGRVLVFGGLALGGAYAFANSLYNGS